MADDRDVLMSDIIIGLTVDIIIRVPINSRKIGGRAFNNSNSTLDMIMMIKLVFKHMQTDWHNFCTS